MISDNPLYDECASCGEVVVAIFRFAQKNVGRLSSPVFNVSRLHRQSLARRARFLLPAKRPISPLVALSCILSHILALFVGMLFTGRYVIQASSRHVRVDLTDGASTPRPEKYASQCVNIRHFSANVAGSASSQWSIKVHYSND